MAEMADFCLAFSERAFWAGFVTGAAIGLPGLVPLVFVVHKRGWLTSLRDVLR